MSWCDPSERGALGRSRAVFHVKHGRPRHPALGAGASLMPQVAQPCDIRGRLGAGAECST